MTPPTPEAKAPEPALGTSLVAKERYTSPEWMRLEWDRMWTKVWLLAGRVSDVAVPGEWFTTEIGPESILVARDGAGALHAYYNVCLHRGNRLRAGERGRATSFQCAYHHWEWRLDGALERVPDPETYRQGLPCERLRLRELRCDVWGGFVFVSLDDAAGPLREYLGVLPEHLDPYRFEDQLLVNDKTIEWDCNWKTSVDAFNETYHVQGIHPQILSWTDDVRVQIDLYERHSRMLVPFGTASPRFPWTGALPPELKGMLASEGLDPATFEGRPADEIRLALQRAKRARAAMPGCEHLRGLSDAQLTDDFHYYLFPNVTLNVFADGFMLFRSRPHPSDPNRMFYDLQNYAHAGPTLRDRPRVPHTHHRHGEISLGEVLDQDAHNLPHVQRGMGSRAFEGLWLCEQERRIRHMHATLDRYLGGA